MGTRTYSRRASNGTRKPTALGIRSGRFIGETRQPLTQYQLYPDPTETSGGRTPAYIQKSIQNGGLAVYNAAQQGTLISPEVQAYIKQKLKLDLSNPADAQLFSDLIGVFAYKNGNASAEVTFSTQGSLRTSTTGLLTSAKDIEFDANGGIRIHNDLTNKKISGAPHMGFFELARQAAAAKELSRRLNKTVYITAVLSSGENKNNEVYNGAHTFGQLGYEIQLTPNPTMSLNTPDLPQIFANAGFPKPSTNQDVLLSTATTGESGFTAWRRLLPKNISLYGRWIFHANNPTVQGDQVMAAYAKKHGYKYPL